MINECFENLKVNEKGAVVGPVAASCSEELPENENDREDFSF
jgi:hypothetical protein